MILALILAASLTPADPEHVAACGDTTRTRPVATRPALIIPYLENHDAPVPRKAKR